MVTELLSNMLRLCVVFKVFQVCGLGLPLIDFSYVVVITKQTKVLCLPRDEPCLFLKLINYKF